MVRTIACPCRGVCPCRSLLGRWTCFEGRCARDSVLHCSAVEPVGEPLLLGADLLLPTRRVPQLDPVDDAGHEHGLPQTGEVPQPCRDGHAPLPVDLHLVGVGRPQPGLVPVGGAQRFPLLFLLHLLGELVGRPQSQTAVVVLGEVAAVLEGGTEPGGKDHPPLDVERVLVRSEEPCLHRSALPCCGGTLPFAPLRTTLLPLSPTVNHIVPSHTPRHPPGAPPTPQAPQGRGAAYSAGGAAPAGAPGPKARSD